MRGSARGAGLSPLWSDIAVEASSTAVRRRAGTRFLVCPKAIARATTTNVPCVFAPYLAHFSYLYIYYPVSRALYECPYSHIWNLAKEFADHVF